MGRVSKLQKKILSGDGSFFGLDPKSELAARLRASQINAIVDTKFSITVVNIVCATVVYFVFSGQPNSYFLPYWVIAFYALSGVAFFHIFENKKRPKRYSISDKSYNKASNKVAIISFLWAILPVMLYGGLSSDYQTIMVAIMCGILGGGAVNLFFVPRAFSIWVVGIGAGCGFALFHDNSFTSQIILVILLAYAISLVKTCNAMAKSFAEGVVSGFKMEEQSETIGLLLKDFSENASDWLWQINKTGQVTRGNDEFKKALGVDFLHIIPGDYEGSFGDANQILNMRSLDSLRKAFKTHQSFNHVEISSSGEQGDRWVCLSGKPLYNRQEEFIGFRGVASDVTHKKITEERIAYLAHNDALTGLVNRANYTKTLQALIEDPKSSNQWSIFYLDLDGFKLVNDTYGHAMGDKLLSAVAKVLMQTVSERDVLARLGGDEFAILCRSAGTAQSTSSLAEAILFALSQPFTFDDVHLDIGVSIGIALRSSDGDDANTLMHNADLALYRAKEEGRGTFRLYEHKMDELIKERRSLEADLKMALRNNQLSLAYQPQIAAKETKTVAFEALVRWHSPLRGDVPPSDFIPIAESIGIVSDIGDWVLLQACMEARKWPSNLSVAVNLSPQQFESNQIIGSVVNALSASGLAPHRLELEITEGLFMENTDEVMYTLRELKSMGVAISLDDFGTGYSSLSYLLKFPFDKLKIDRSLISSLDHDENAQNVLEAITKLASVMNLTVTAEGIETLDQVKVMLGMHCTHFQGFLFGKPLNTHDLHEYLDMEFSNSEYGEGLQTSMSDTQLPKKVSAA